MLSILLINDNKIVSRLLQLSSKKSGFDIEESGIFSPSNESYNLIFIDSDKYNHELVQKIKNSLTYDKLVFIGTNQAKQPEDFELMLEKPFLPADFTSLVENNFVVETSEDEEQDDVKLEDDIEDEELLDLDEELNSFDDVISNDPEELSKLVDDIEDIDEKKEDELERLEEELVEEPIDDEIENIDEDEDEQDLPDIDDEIEEEDIDSLDELLEDEEPEPEVEVEKDELLSLDEDELKSVVETELVEEEVEKEEVKTEDENEEKPDTQNIQEIVRAQLKELITSDLLKEALKDMELNITFSDKN